MPTALIDATSPTEFQRAVQLDGQRLRQADNSLTLKELPLLCNNLRFLVVEDHNFQRRLIVGFLERMGALQVQGFADGAPALAAMNDPAQNADIVILDLSMPGMDGMTLMNQLRPGAHDFSIIINSALSPSLLASFVLTTQRLGVHLLGVVSKPMTEANLAPLIALHRSRARD